MQSAKTVEVKDTVREQVLVEVHDTVRELTTVAIQLGATGDTLKVSTVTDRTTVRDRARAQDREEKLTVRVDTVYIEKKDSSLVESSKLQVQSMAEPSKLTRITTLIKWLFAIVCAIIVLIFTIKIFLRRGL